MKRILLLACIGTLTLGLTAFGAPKGGKGGGKPAKGGASVHAAAKGGGHGARQAAPAKMSRGHANVSRGSAKMSRGSTAKMSRGASASRMRGSSVASKSAKVRGGNNAAMQRGNGKMRGATASNSKMRGRENVAAQKGRGNAKAFRNDRGAAAANVANANAQAAANGKVRGGGKFDRNATGVAGSAVTGGGGVVNQTVVPGRSTIVNNWAGVTGPSYTAFRDYRQEWHDRGWYDSNYTRVILVTGGWGWWFWNSGYWYPAWGYDPYYRSYPYDGPIYGYRDLTPDQIVITVQRELRNDGYYAGSVDGVLGPQTRRALAAFQADHGLAVTSAVDEPTLQTLGLT